MAIMISIMPVRIDITSTWTGVFFFSFWAYCSAFGITNGKEFHKISTAVENDQSLLVFDLSSEY